MVIEIESIIYILFEMAMAYKEEAMVTGSEAPSKKETLGSMPSMKNPMTNQNMGVQSQLAHHRPKSRQTSSGLSAAGQNIIGNKTYGGGALGLQNKSGFH